MNRGTSPQLSPLQPKAGADAVPRDVPPPLALGIATAVVLVGMMTWFRYGLLGAVVLPIGYGVPIVLMGYFRRPWLLWATAAAFGAIVLLRFVLPEVAAAAAQPPPVSPHAQAWIFAGLILMDLVVVTAVVHWWIASRNDAEGRASDLRVSLDDVAAREEEIARQNEELQSQTEELERQSEELRVTNEELARREKMLEALLDLARSLRAGLHQDETMGRICEGLARLVGEAAAAAIIQRTDGSVRVMCHHGFGAAGVANETIPYERSFAALVLERGRTGYLDDLSLRPDLEVPQPKDGPPMQSILAAPLLVGGRVYGALELYGRHRQSWSDEQVALVESLAAQASISLEAARLFEQVERERTRLAAILKTAPVGISISNADYTDVRTNLAGGLLLGIDPSVNLAEHPYRDLYRKFRDGRPVPFESHVLPRALRGETVTAEEVEVVLHGGGRRLVLLLSAAPIRDKDGHVTGAVSAFADITARKQLERELDARRREAEESSVRKSRFLAAVSHDIRTPANAISLLAELIQRTSSSPDLAGEVPQLAKELHGSALNLVNLVSDVLDVTRLDSGKIDLTESEFSLAQLLAEECTQLIPVARVKNLELACRSPERPVYVRTDRVKLGRVLGNLINNAIKFTERGSIVVTGRVNDGVEITVADTGIGIPPEANERIFDEFFQLRHRDRTHTGSGLGLTISRRLVDAMGGKLTVESEPGKGSVFTIALPPGVIASGPPVA